MDLSGFTDYYQKGIYPKYEKVYVIGDIHGDLKAFLYALRLANVIDRKLNWVGGNTHIVQIGDIFDRKTRTENYNDEDSEFKICALILKLQYQSYKSGGGFHSILGNHELMNVMGIYDYVSPEGMNHFKKNNSCRSEYFKPGSYFSKYLACTWNPVIKIGDSIFCHGGITPKIASKYKISEINILMRDYLYGNKNHESKSYFKELFLGPQSILWNRDFSVNDNNNNNRNNIKVKEVLSKLNSKYMVIGHTIQSNGIINRYDGSVWNVDTGMSEAFGTRKNPKERIQILFFENNKPRIVKYL